ncbi:hypothetical protein C7S15_5466 [Burkholderia cepacia]|nr:hypothetical protein [Burkholderia cepacia]
MIGPTKRGGFVQFEWFDVVEGEMIARPIARLVWRCVS